MCVYIYIYAYILVPVTLNVFTLSANSYRFCLQLDFLLFILVISNSGNYLHLRTIVVAYIIKQYAVITYWVKIIIVIQIAKWMSPYWDNKSLPTSTLTLPDTLSSTFRLFPSLLLKIHAFPMWYLIWKGREKKFWQNVDSNQGWSRQKGLPTSNVL